MIIWSKKNERLFNLLDRQFDMKCFFLFGSNQCYFATYVGEEFSNCAPTSCDSQPVPEPDYLEENGVFLGDALILNQHTSHWQTSFSDDLLQIVINNDLYFAKKDDKEAQLPIRQVSQYTINGQSAGFFFMDTTLTRLTKPSTSVFVPPDACLNPASSRSSPVFEGEFHQEAEVILRSLFR